MKLTTKQIREIIKEELSSMLRENEDNFSFFPEAPKGAEMMNVDGVQKVASIDIHGKRQEVYQEIHQKYVDKLLRYKDEAYASIVNACIDVMIDRAQQAFKGEIYQHMIRGARNKRNSDELRAKIRKGAQETALKSFREGNWATWGYGWAFERISQNPKAYFAFPSYLHDGTVADLFEKQVKKEDPAFDKEFKKEIELTQEFLEKIHLKQIFEPQQRGAALGKTSVVKDRELLKSLLELYISGGIT